MTTIANPTPGGGWAELRRALRAYRRKVYDRQRAICFAMPLDEAVLPAPPRFPARLVFDAPDRVLDFIHRLNVPGTCDPVELRAMQERGHLFVGLEEGTKLVGFAKLGWGTVYVVEYRMDLVLQPGDCFVLESYVIPARRGLGAGPYLIYGTNVELRQRGFRRRLSLVRTDNAVMLRTAARVGYRNLGTVDYVSVCGRKTLRPHPSVLWAASSGQAILEPM